MRYSRRFKSMCFLSEWSSSITSSYESDHFERAILFMEKMRMNLKSQNGEYLKNKFEDISLGIQFFNE